MNWILGNLDLIGSLSWVHVRHSLIPLAIGFAVSIPLGWLAWRLKALRSPRSEEHTSELQSRGHLVCRLLLEKKKWKYVRVMCTDCVGCTRSIELQTCAYFLL